MPRNASDFVSFLAGHFRPIEAMCKQRARFVTDDEVVAFLRPFEADDKNLTRLIGRMRESGVLVELAGEWSPPPFLVEFMEKLFDRHGLASPKVIQSWLESLQKHVQDLKSQIESARFDASSFDAESGQFLLRQISDVFQTIVRTVQDNCERIAKEVADYRLEEDSTRLRSRLERLIFLHDEYLEPVIRIVDIRGDFYSVSEQVAVCCTRLSVLLESQPNSLADESRSIQRDVIWLRRVVVRRAEEARRELAPLCEAAARESKIARGVNQAIESIRCENWSLLDLEGNLPVIEERDGSLYSDRAIDRFMRVALTIKERTPPRITTTAPVALEIPITPDDLLDRLETIPSIDDLLEWVLDSCEEISLNAAVQLFHSVLEIAPKGIGPTETRSSYERDNLIVNATRWTWKGPSNGDGIDPKLDGHSPRKARRSVPTA